MVPPSTALSNPVFFTGILYSLHLATIFNGDRGSVLDSTKSDIVNMVPSNNFTTAVSLLGPESSTYNIDLAESFKITSNSEEVTAGMSAAFDMVGRALLKSIVDDAVVKMLDSRFRRCIIWLPLLCVLEGSSSLFWGVTCNFMISCVDDECRLDSSDVVENPDTRPSLHIKMIHTASRANDSMIL